MRFGIEDLDKVLRYLLADEEYAFKSLSDITHAFDRSKLTVADTVSIKVMLEKLIKDDYIEALALSDISAENQLFGKRYKITFEGILFIQQDGYSGRAKSIALREISQTFAVWIAAIGTGVAGVYALVEIFRNYLPKCVPFQSLAASFLFGVSSVLLVMLIRLLIRKAVKSNRRGRL